MSNFGASFRKAREAAGLPLEKIAADTRITTRFLLAIESDEFHLLPGGIFNRGFIRAYAERLGMDPDQAVADYDSLSAATQEPLEVLRNAERASTRRTERNLYPIAAAILVLLIGGYYVANRRFSTTTAPQAPAAQAAAVQPAPISRPEPPVSTAEVLPKADAPSAAIAPVTVAPAPFPATVEAAVASPPPPVPIPIELANRPVETPGSSPAALLPALPAARPTAAPTPTVPPATTAPLSAIPTAMTTRTLGTASPLVLDVDIKDSTWIQIAADGTIVLADNLQPGTSRRFSADRSLEVTIGNAAGASLKINGRDMGVLGANGRVRQFRITPENAARIQG